MKPNQRLKTAIAMAALAAACSGCAKLDAFWHPIDEREYAEESVRRQMLEMQAESRMESEMLTW